MRELSFNIEAARRYGVDGAILLQGMAAWISKNRANERHFHDGRWWTYNSKAALARLFPFWTEKQIRRIVNALTAAEAILQGNYSDGSYHNTTWYALSDDVLELLGAGECASLYAGMPGIGPEERIATGGGAALAMTEGGGGPAAAGVTSPPASPVPLPFQGRQDRGPEEAGESTCPNGQVMESTCPNGQIDLPERAGTQEKLLKESKAKQVNTNNPPIAPQGVALAAAELEELLEGWYGGRRVPEDDRREALKLYADLRQRVSRTEIEAQLGAWVIALGPGALPLRELFRSDTWREDPYFWLCWQMYPRKIDKDRARRAWKKLSPARAMVNAILEGLRSWKKCDQWQEERFIPHPTTWLNGQRWEATPPAGRAAPPEPPEREVEEWT